MSFPLNNLITPGVRNLRAELWIRVDLNRHPTPEKNPDPTLSKKPDPDSTLENQIRSES